MKIIWVISMCILSAQLTAQGIAFTAISKKGDTINGHMRKHHNPYNIPKGFTALNEKGDPMFIKPKKYKEVRVDTIYLINLLVRQNPKLELFVEPIVNGHLSLYLARFTTSSTHNVGVVPSPSGNWTYTQFTSNTNYYLSDSKGSITMLSPKTLQKHPERYFSYFPFILDKMRSLEKNYIELPRIIEEYNTKRVFLSEAKKDVVCEVISNSNDQISGIIKNYDASFLPTKGFILTDDTDNSLRISPKENAEVRIDTLVYNAKPDSKDNLWFMRRMSTGPLATLYEHSFRVSGSLPGNGMSSWIEKDYYIQSGEIWIRFKEKELLEYPERYFPKSLELCKYIRNRERDEIDLTSWVDQYNKMNR